MRTLGRSTDFPRFSPLRQVLVPWALGEHRHAAELTFAAFTSEDRSAFWEEASRFGLTSLAEAVLGTSDVDGYQVARRRVESFKAAHHAQKTWEAALALTRAGIPTIVLKGAPLAEELYEANGAQFWMRPAQDIDLFVHPESIFEGADALQQAGYVPKHPEALRRARAQNSVRHALDFIPREQTGITQFSIDLHAHLSHSPWRENLEFSHFFERSVPWKKRGEPQASAEGDGEKDGGISPRRLSPLDEAIFLASHGVGHRFQNPKWALDVARSFHRLKSSGVDGDALVERARSCRCEGALALSLAYLDHCALGSVEGLPPHLTASLEDTTWNVLRKKLFALALSLPEDRSSPIFFLRGGLTCLSLMDTFHPNAVYPLMKLALEKVIDRQR